MESFLNKKLSIKNVMIKMGRQEEKIRGITPRSIAFGLISMILALVLTEYTLFTSPYPNKGWPFNLVWVGSSMAAADGFIQRNFYFTAILYMLFPIVFNALLPKKLRLNGWELAFVAAMMTPIFAVAGFSDGGFLAARTVTMLRAGLMSDVTRDYIMEYASPLFGPKDIELLAPIETGGGVVPWSEWMLPIAWWLVFYMSFFGILLFIGALVRRLWVDIESLPFPLVAPVSTIINEVSGDRPSDTPSMFKSQYLWLGFIIAFVIFIAQGARNLFPGAPPFTPAVDLTPLAIATGVYEFAFNPLALGIGTFLPDAVLLTTSISYILLFMILPAVLWVPIGWLQPLPPGRNCWWTWNRFIGKFEFYEATPLRGGYMSFAWGAIIGLGLYPLITNWRYFREITLGLLGKKISGEESEALPYRLAWLGLIVSCLVYLGALAAVNVPVHFGILQLIIVIPFWVGLMRYNAEAGFGLNLIGGWSEWSSIPYQFFIPWTGMDKMPEVAAPWMATTFMHTNTCWGGGGNMYTNAFSLDGYKLASTNRAKNRDMFIMQCIAVVLSLIIGIPFMLWMHYTFGTTPSRVGHMNNLAWYFSYRPVVEGVLHNPVWTPNASMIGNVIFGFLFVFILYYLRRYVGGIFNYASAAGILVTLNAGLNLWLSFLIIFIARFALNKIGGVPLQRRILIPFGSGIFLAGCLWMPLNLGLNWLFASMGWY